MDHIEKNLTCMENQPPEGITHRQYIYLSFIMQKIIVNTGQFYNLYLHLMSSERNLILYIMQKKTKTIQKCFIMKSWQLNFTIIKFLRISCVSHMFSKYRGNHEKHARWRCFENRRVLLWRAGHWVSVNYHFMSLLLWFRINWITRLKLWFNEFFIFVFSLPRNRRAKQNMIDVFGVLSTPMSDKILAEKIFLNPNPDPELVTRILTHLATKPNSPHEV